MSAYNIKTWDSKTWINNAYYAVLGILVLVSTLPPEIINILPGKWRPYVGVSAALLAWWKSHGNLFSPPPPEPPPPPTPIPPPAQR